MKAFVTGSTGLLGNNLVRLLVEQGYAVKALVRSPEKAAKLFHGLDIELIRGDMLDVDSFASKLAGCDILFHTAAYFREYYQPGNHWQILKDINVKGTIKLLKAAENHGIKKVIYVSSSGPLGMKSSGVPGDETTPNNSLAMTNLYFKSKVLAEEEIYKFLQQHSLPVVLILPGWMFAPRDTAPTNSGQLVQDYIKRKIPGIIDGGACIVDARDVAQGMINAVEKGKSGERYIVAGKYSTLENIFYNLAKISGIPAPKLRLPYKLTVILAWFSDNYAKFTGTKSVIPLEGIKIMHDKIELSSTKAIKELGVNFRPLKETLDDVVNWYRQYGIKN